jgi:ATP-dependent helicase/nuclease subunit A
MRKLLQEAETAAIPEETAAALGWWYPWGDVAALPSKVSATSLLDRDRNWRGPIPAPEIRRTPRFLEERKAFSATDLGTFAHTALQLLDINTDPCTIPDAVADLERRGLLPEGAAVAIDAGWLTRFHRSGIARRIRQSTQVQRELPFNLAVKAHIVFPGETGDEEILVQGIIDCCFVENGKWVLVDYKTNRVDEKNTVEKIAAYYKPQLQTYRTALEEITGIEVREAWLYLLSVGAEVKVAL